MMSTPLPRPAAGHAALARAVNASPDLAALEAAFERPAEAGGGGREPPAHRLAAADGRLLAARWFEPAGRHRWVAHAFFHAMLPAAAHLLGKAPGWVLGGSGAGLPKGVALDWARWGRRRGYLFSDPDLAAHLTRYRQYRGPAHLWHISDDRTYGPAAAVDALAAQFSAARVERPALDAAALRSGPIGHFGAFRAEPGRRIWPQWLERIEWASPALRAALHGA